MSLMTRVEKVKAMAATVVRDWVSGDWDGICGVSLGRTGEAEEAEARARARLRLVERRGKRGFVRLGKERGRFMRARQEEWEEGLGFGGGRRKGLRRMVAWEVIREAIDCFGKSIPLFCLSKRRRSRK